jgi:hypothetical protein
MLKNPKNVILIPHVNSTNGGWNINKNEHFNIQMKG